MNNKRTLQTKAGFKIPPTYFADFDARLKEKLIRKQLPNTTISSGMEVPKDYFINFSVKLPVEREIKTIPLFSSQKIKYAVAVAAIVVLFFSIFNQNLKMNNKFSSIDQEKIGAYLEYYPSEFSYLEGLFLEKNTSNEIEFGNIDNDQLFNYLTKPTSELSFVNY